jgi:hypothetical protein
MRSGGTCFLSRLSFGRSTPRNGALRGGICFSSYATMPPMIVTAATTVEERPFRSLP